MAGLLDFFGSPDAQLGLGLLAAAAPRAGGVSFGQGMQEALSYVDKQRQMKAAEMAQAQEMAYKKALMEDHQRKAVMEQAAMAQAARKQQALPGLWTGGSQALAPLVGNSELGIMPSQGRAAAPGTLDVQAALRAGYSPDEIAKLDGLRNIGMNKVARTIDVEGANGGKTVRGLDDYGRPVFDQNGYVAPVSVNQGNRTTFVKPSAGLSLPMGMSPSERDASARGWAGNALANQRLQFDMNGGMDSGGASQMGLNKQFGKPQAGYRWKSDGSMEFIPGGPADQKAQAQKGGEGTVGGVVADLRDKYTQLDAENGIVSTNNRFGTNLGAAFGASAVGQTLNGMVGTKTQSARDSIAMTRPLLLQAIMKATGMSAKQMDSNAELKLYLATATDPQKGLEANLEALDRIESLYGGGNERFKAKGPQAATVNGWSMEKVQ